MVFGTFYMVLRDVRGSWEGLGWSLEGLGWFWEGGWWSWEGIGSTQDGE